MDLEFRFDKELTNLAEKLSETSGVSVREAVHCALENALHSAQKIKTLQREIQAFPATALPADKTFYDAFYEY